MKLIICTFLVFFCLSGIQAQKGYVTKAIMELGLPCAQEVGLSSESLKSIQSGDILSIQEGFGCFADCIAKKLGMIADDNSFHLGKYRERIGKIVLPEVAAQLEETCKGSVGTENCKISGSVLHCSLTKIVDIFYE
ncbi:general odorant-binding protein 56a-like [Lutzomyia longipalpis]|uniref:general odorant-binding protein 56a-like n=1 Tax=Lutzomyia longipalpis TaxID=7200 RepID=UPI0024842906|nr:general odorant-binding protein 56a-like [Lutzomyia longipalpis]